MELKGQLGFFDKPLFKTSKTIRLIELFAGIGSQAKALRNLGVPFEHHFVCEIDKYACMSYAAVHGVDVVPTDVSKIKASDLNITDTDNYTYLLTYSFPCTDLSVAGKMQGMAEGSGTRSSLLWEVRRLISECDELPQILVMENVPQVHGKANMPHFQKWIEFLEQKGYSNYWQDLNAKDYGVAQSRNRTFLVSILGEWGYEFPKPVELEKCMKDYLQEEVEGKYYITSDKAKNLVDNLVKEGKIFTDRQTDRQSINLNKTKLKVNADDVAYTLMARDYKGMANFTPMNGVCEKQKNENNL